MATATKNTAAKTAAPKAVDTSNVQILKVGHALIDGDRGASGGAPSKDSIWGVATIGGNVVKFFGRRGGKLRFKTEKKADLEAALTMFQDKVAGKGGKDYAYTELTAKKIDELVPNLAASVKTGFYAAQREGKVNNRSTAKGAKAPAAKPAKTTKAKAKADAVAAE